MAKNDKFPRLFNLVMLLLDTRKPLSLDEIARRIGGFPDSPSARHQAFERAKKELRELGIPIITHQIPGEEQYGYTIDQSEMIIPDLRFNDQEASALAAASALVSFGGGERESALEKLGCVVSGIDPTVAKIPSQPTLFRLFEAMGSGRVVRFDYRLKRRTLDIYGISFRWGNWYLLGNERESGEIKTFLIDRLESEAEILDVEGLEKPADFDISSRLPKNRWEIGGEQLDARVHVHPDITPMASFELGEQNVVSRMSDGSAVLAIRLADRASFFDWLLGYGTRARLIAPDSVVEEFIGYLEKFLSGAESAEVRALWDHLEPADDGMASMKGPEMQSVSNQVVENHQLAKRGELRTATSMYSVLVRILPWLARKGSTTVDEIAKTFGINGTEVVRLLEIAACCGLPPYTPDSLLEILVEDDGNVESYLNMDLITAPRKLTTLEAMVLATTAAAALKVPEIDPEGHLASALGKLQSSLSKFEIALNEVDVGMEEPYFLGAVRSATNEHRSIKITYFSSSSERVTERLVDPYQLFAESGKWYLRAFCHLAGEVRHFSIGRVMSCEASDSFFEVPEPEKRRISQGVIPRAYGGSGEWATVAVSPGTGWLVERLSDSPEFLGKHLGQEVYRLRFSSDLWLSKFLLRLGPTAMVIAPSDRRSLRTRAVQQIIELYRDKGSVLT